MKLKTIEIMTEELAKSLIGKHIYNTINYIINQISKCKNCTLKLHFEVIIYQLFNKLMAFTLAFSSNPSSSKLVLTNLDNISSL